MKQRILTYAAAFAAWLVTYCGVLALGWQTAAVGVLLLAIPGAALVARREYRLSEQALPQHRGWRDGQHVRQVLHTPESRPAPWSFRGDVYSGVVRVAATEPEPAVEAVPTIEELALAATEQQMAVLDEIHDRYQAAQDEGMRAVDAIASGDAARELGVA